MRKHIVRVPNAGLRAISADLDLTKPNQNIAKLVADLSDTLVKKENPKGVGLSAPQIGKNARMFAVLLAETDNTLEPTEQEDPDPPQLTIFINPKILERSPELTLGPDPEHPYLEGCLSIPNLYGPLPRHTWVRLGYFDTSLKYVEKLFYGFYARVVQHEQDHLDGILFTDYILKYALPLYQQQNRKMVEIDRTIASTF